MLKSGDGTERRDRDRQIDLVVRTGTPKQRLVAIAVALAEPLTIINEIEAANRRQMNFTLLLELQQCEYLLHQRAASLLALGMLFTEHRHGEGITGGRL